MVNRQNYLWVRAYLSYLAEHRQMDPKSVIRYRFYLRHLLLWAMEHPLSDATSIQPTFGMYLAAVENDGRPLAKETLKKIVATTQRLFRWLRSTYIGEFRKIPESWIDTLTPPRRVGGIPEHRYVSLDYVMQITMLTAPPDDLAARRDCSAAAMLFLSGMRASAFVSLPIGCVDIAGRAVRQDPAAGVRTKNGKAQVTYLLDIPPLLDVVRQWHTLVAARLPTTASWYAPITSRWGEQELTAEPPGDNRNVALAKRLRLLAARAGLPYLSPHKYRHGHAVYALQGAKDMADYKAVSQNLMHADISVTDGIYAPLLGSEVRQRIASLETHVSPTDGASKVPEPRLNDLLKQVADPDSEVIRALKVLAKHMGAESHG